MNRNPLPVRLSPRPVAAMLYRFGRACETVVFWSTLAAKGTVAAAFLLFLSAVPA